jgi:hypothetical protein
MAQPGVKFRSFSDRSSWVITFDQASIVSPQLGFGTSIPARHSLYTSSLMMLPPPPEQDDRQRPKTELSGVVLRSKLLRLDHIMCSVKLSGFVQQFLTRQMIAYPGRATSQCAQALLFPSSVTYPNLWSNTALMPRYHSSCKPVSRKQTFAMTYRLTRPSGPS